MNAKKAVKTAVVFLGVGLVVSFGMILLWNKRHVLDSSGSIANPAATTTQDPALPKTTTPISKDAAGRMSVEERLVYELKKFYGKTISKKSTQVGLLKVKLYVLNMFPEDGIDRFHRILRKAFPDLAEEIIATLEKMEQYQAWAEDNAYRLSQMNSLEKEGTIWEKRRDIFGEDAEDIWSEDVLAFQRKKEEVRETIRYLDEADDMNLYEKLDIYTAALNDAYDGSSEEYVLQNKDLLSKVFFSIDSVQEELQRLAPEQRRMEIDKIRREMGFSQQQVEKAAEFDAYREQRWENGLEYMAEREKTAASFEGPELEEQLDALRKKYFQHEAKTIAIEENEGFFRFKRPRIYGRN